MMPFLRFVSLGALLYGLFEVAKNAQAETRGGDLTNAFWLAYCVVLGIVAALLWAPTFADRMIDPLTGITPEPTFVARPNRLMRLIRWLDGRNWRRLVRGLCFVEGVRNPWNPAPFVIGMKNSEPGSWLEYIYARQVYGFTNAENCVRAYEILRRHGRVPGLHSRAEVNRLVAALDKAAAPVEAPMQVPESDAPPLERNRRIALPHNLDRRTSSPDPDPSTSNPDS